ncbi:DNA-formamidopyrimidine glycosylase [Candidatus Peregrinibacteria bacterium RIFOXYB2_FULL_32_7]|nr:MAG: DNA-formamidopyrimidine glycosylase [Candidatus Peregrinibacteria bacterium RIFOXYB2_FULL_32_7]
MPELPEVETVRRILTPYVLNKKIIKVQILADKIIKGEKDFAQKIIGQSFTKINRRGKLLIFQLFPSNLYLCAHLKMTGQLMYANKNVFKVGGGHGDNRIDFHLPHQYTRAIFIFEDKSKLFFNDLRLFAYLKIVDKKILEKIYSAYGIEPGLENFNWNNFKNLFKKSQRSLKAFLLDQSKIAGLGNIYVDEICYYAKIKPMRKISDLSVTEIKRLYTACKIIIAKAIDHCGTTFQHFKIMENGKVKKGGFFNYLQVFRQEGKACKRCGSKYLIKKIKFAGRGTHFCDHCQA